MMTAPLSKMNSGWLTVVKKYYAASSQENPSSVATVQFLLTRSVEEEFGQKEQNHVGECSWSSLSWSAVTVVVAQSIK